MELLLYWYIRRTERGKWFGKTMLSLPPCKHLEVNVGFPASLIGSLDQVESAFKTAVLQKEDQQILYAAQFPKTAVRQVWSAATLPPLRIYWLGSTAKGINNEKGLFLYESR